MLLYLSNNTRPDIAVAVSQVCRFTHNPKKSHASAVKTILRYLKRTADQGTYIVPDGTLELNSYCDADFGSLFQRDPPEEPTSARSRTGFVIKLGGTPLLWKSQLQTTVALSTAMAEYHALSTLMRVAIPLRRLLIEVVTAVEAPPSLRATILSRVFEDNQATLILANEQRITSRTRHYHIQLHHFWEQVHPRGPFRILGISTHLQAADMLTKSMPRLAFENCRKLNQGW
jgi:hypothetical protein